MVQPAMIVTKTLHAKWLVQPIINVLVMMVILEVGNTA